MISPGFPKHFLMFLTFTFLMTSAAASATGKQKSLTASPSSISFGSVAVGGSSSQRGTVTNSGNGSVTISQVTTTGAGFSLSGLNLPLMLSSGQSYTFSIIFTPASSASASGSVSLISNASNSTLTIGLSGTATAAGQLTVSPTAFDFGSVVVGTSTSLSDSLTASGSSVTVSSATSSSPEFTLSGLTFPMTIAAGQRASFSITFTPQASGTASATISFASNAPNSPTIASLTGTGISATPHSVALSWSADSSVVNGYNIYRSATLGGAYAKINSVLNAPTDYLDTSVQAGQTYYYVTTAVDASGTESSYSNQVQAVIPTP
jgi:hypothetical protein